MLDSYFLFVMILTPHFVMCLVGMIDFNRIGRMHTLNGVIVNHRRFSYQTHYETWPRKTNEFRFILHVAGQSNNSGHLIGPCQVHYFVHGPAGQFHTFCCMATIVISFVSYMWCHICNICSSSIHRSIQIYIEDKRLLCLHVYNITKMAYFCGQSRNYKPSAEWT